MAPPKKKDDSDLQQQDVLQAVVLADSFASNFRPVTFEMPKVLMPIANVPMIEYTLEFLAAGGVQEIFIFCCAHADEVERYVRESQVARRLATVALRVLKSRGDCMSPGDALREVESRGVIKSDFVLCPGDVISNLSLAPLIAAHKARLLVDREAVLTTVMSRVPISHRARRAGEEKLVALSGETGRLLMYDEAAKRDWEHKVRLPMALLQETDRFELHRDLYDTHIDVCTPELLTLLQDNFDWQDLRRDLLPGILGQFEMLGKTIYTHVLSTEYAARVHDPHTYDIVSRDLIGRWAFPLVPDANLLPGYAYRCTAACVYEESGVSLARSAALVRDTVIGSASTVGERSTIDASVIGRNCVIGSGVTLSAPHPRLVPRPPRRACHSHRPRRPRPAAQRHLAPVFANLAAACTCARPAPCPSSWMLPMGQRDDRGRRDADERDVLRGGGGGPRRDGAARLRPRPRRRRRRRVRALALQPLLGADR